MVNFETLNTRVDKLSDELELSCRLVTKIGGIMSAKSVNVVVSIEVNNTNPNVIGFWDKVDNFLMTAAEEELGLNPGSGSVEEGTVVSLVMGETQTIITANFSFAGEWTKNV